MNEETKNRLRARFEQMLNEIGADKRPLVTISDLESLALDLREQIGQAALEEASRELQEAPGAAPSAEGAAGDSHPGGVSPCIIRRDSPPKMACPDCCRQAWYKGERCRAVVTLVGAVRLSRRYYYCRRCDKGFCPADLRLGLPQDTLFSVRLTQEVAYLSACLPFEQATQTLRRLTGVSVSSRSAERLCLAQAGVQAEAFRVARDRYSLPLAYVRPSALPADLPRPDVLYVEADGVQTPMKGGSYQEMKVGVVRAEHADGREAQASRYVNLLGDSGRFGEQLESLAITCGSLTAKRVVFLGDGATWLWKLASDRFPRAVQVLDFWHALEYVAKVARDAFPETFPDGVSEDLKKTAERILAEPSKPGETGMTWLSERAAEMKASAWPAFYQALTAVQSRAKESVTAVQRYFHNNRSRMDYARYLRWGICIGSGLAESSCKRIVTQRLKGSGMHWSQIGAQAVAALRSLLLGGQWDTFTDFWNQTNTNYASSPLS